MARNIASLSILPTFVDIPVPVPVVVEEPVVLVPLAETYAPTTGPLAPTILNESVLSTDILMLDDFDEKFLFSLVSVNDTSVAPEAYPS